MLVMLNVKSLLEALQSNASARAKEAEMKNMAEMEGKQARHRRYTR
jgi:hypothetical protein